MRGGSRVRRWLRQLQPRVLILLYHRVADLKSDPQLLGVTPKNFSEHLQVLRQRYRVVRLGDLTSGRHPLHGRGLNVVITFDDGYADNLHHVRPALESAGTPATVFVTTGKIDDDREFWWDELERIFLLTPRLPPKLTLRINDKPLEWQFDDSETHANGEQRWHVLLDAAPSSRQRAYLDLVTGLREKNAADRLRIVDELFEWAGICSRGRPSHRPLSQDEVRELGKDDLVEVGAHTVTHSSLPAITRDAQRTEIFDSKAMLERLLQEPVRSFSYPFGHYDPSSMQLVRDAGFDCASTTAPGVVTRGSNPYQWPRLLVRDWDGEEFDQRLAAAFRS